MTLKQILMTGFFIGNISVLCLADTSNIQISPNKDSSEFVQTVESQNYSCAGLGMGLLTILSAKIAYDLSWHATSARYITDMYDQFMYHIQTHDITSLNDMQLYKFFTQEIIEFIAIYEEWMRTSYTSYVRFWNWNNEQKIAHEKIQLLSMIALHGPMIALGGSLKSQDIIIQARKHYFIISEYPLLTYSQFINTHIDTLSTSLSFPLEDKVMSFIFELKRNIYTLRAIFHSDRDYALEFYNMRLHNHPRYKSRNW